MNPIEFSKSAIVTLKLTSPQRWGKTFVDLRMEFCRRFQKKTFSTSHGTDFFENVIACADGEAWTEKGEYGDNFRQFINEATRPKA